MTCSRWLTEQPGDRDGQRQARSRRRLRRVISSELDVLVTRQIRVPEKIHFTTGAQFVHLRVVNLIVARDAREAIKGLGSGDGPATSTCKCCDTFLALFQSLCTDEKHMRKW